MTDLLERTGWLAAGPASAPPGARPAPAQARLDRPRGHPRVPVYITTEASLPMVAALVHGGLGLGPAMAFLVTGAGTSIGAITGAFVIALVVALLFTGALVLGALTGAILG